MSQEPAARRMIRPSKPPATAPTMTPTDVPPPELELEELAAEEVGAKAAVEVEKTSVEVTEGPVTTGVRLKLLEVLCPIIKWGIMMRKVIFLRLRLSC